jgi:hypothetical protein
MSTHVSQAHNNMDDTPLQWQCLNTHLEWNIHRLENQPDSRNSILQDESFACLTSARSNCVSAVAERTCWPVNHANVLKKDAPRTLSMYVRLWLLARLKTGIHIAEEGLSSVRFVNHCHGGFHKSVNMDCTAVRSNRFTNEQWPRHVWVDLLIRKQF